MTLQKLVVAFSASLSGRPMPISIAIRLPVFTERLVMTPNDPSNYAGTVSSIILGRPTPNMPPHIPNKMRPKQIV